LKADCSAFRTDFLVLYYIVKAFKFSPHLKNCRVKAGIAVTHTVWKCKYHIVWIPENRRKIIYGKLRKDIGAISRCLCRYKRILDEAGIRRYIKNQQTNESVMDEYDSNMDKDPFKGAGTGKGDADKQAVTELTIWPQVSAYSEAGIPLRVSVTMPLQGVIKPPAWPVVMTNILSVWKHTFRLE